MKTLPRNLLSSVPIRAHKSNRLKKKTKKSQKFKIKFASNYLIIDFKKIGLFVVLNTADNQLIDVWRFIHTEYFHGKCHNDQRWKKSKQTFQGVLLRLCPAVQKENHNQTYLLVNFSFLNFIGPGLGVFTSAFFLKLFNVSRYHVDMLIIPIFKSIVI